MDHDERFATNVLGASIAFVAMIAAIAAVKTKPAASSAVYAVAFWHYYLYALAYFLGRIPIAGFRRAAVFMKCVSLASFAIVYFAAPVHALSLAVMTLGFALNASAAYALGSDRTCYGCEVAGLPRTCIEAFPYSWIAHPMLIGNMIGYGGALLHSEFRGRWLPLAATHITLNFGLLLMESRGSPGSLRKFLGSHGWITSHKAAASSAVVWAVAAVGVAIADATAWFEDAAAATCLLSSVCVVGYAHVLFECFSTASFNMPRADLERVSRL